MIFGQGGALAVGILDHRVFQGGAELRPKFRDIFVPKRLLLDGFFIGERSFFGELGKLVDPLDLFFVHRDLLFGIVDSTVKERADTADDVSAILSICTISDQAFFMVRRQREQTLMDLLPSNLILRMLGFQVLLVLRWE